ncbi:MAG: coproporphyrinogen dehydrogenase HemZ, partial [Firmicutes bacterium]|nr:coproporphyrinogen dehydrogenase HemZ [Bacillota bacterium]
MITVICLGHSFRYEMENVCRIFFPQEKFLPEPQPGVSDCITLIRTETGCEAQLSAAVLLGEKSACRQTSLPRSFPDYEKECERQLAVLLYQLLTEYCGFTSKWGILTGVRPVKLMHRLTGELGEQGAFDYFTRRLLVSPEKTALCRQTAELQEPIVRASRPESFSLYVSIPFCPTRCAYCSFVSQSIEKASKLLPDYVEYLKKELRQTGEIARALGLRLETVYFGGGTPTTLSAEQ